ncbi:MAG: hypothetical protein HY907_20820 [Deltaproteobacteria bacterium]|nr:hypothetical protein [Deltaproteobacteria bacterium]
MRSLASPDARLAGRRGAMHLDRWLGFATTRPSAAVWFALACATCDARTPCLVGDAAPDGEADVGTEDVGAVAVADATGTDVESAPWGCPDLPCSTPCRPVPSASRIFLGWGHAVAAGFSASGDTIAFALDALGSGVIPSRHGLEHVVVRYGTGTSEPRAIWPHGAFAAAWSGVEFAAFAWAGTDDTVRFLRFGEDGALRASVTVTAAHDWLADATMLWTGTAYVLAQSELTLRMVAADGTLGDPFFRLHDILGRFRYVWAWYIAWGPSGPGLLVVDYPWAAGYPEPSRVSFLLLDSEGREVYRPLPVGLGPLPLDEVDGVTFHPAPFGFVVLAVVPVAEEDPGRPTDRLRLRRGEVRVVLLSDGGETLAGPLVVDTVDALNRPLWPAATYADAAATERDALVAYYRQNIDVETTEDPIDDERNATTRLRTVALDGTVGDAVDLDEPLSHVRVLRSGGVVAVAGSRFWGFDVEDQVVLWTGCCE